MDGPTDDGESDPYFSRFAKRRQHKNHADLCHLQSISAHCNPFVCLSVCPFIGPVIEHASVVTLSMISYSHMYILETFLYIVILP